MTYWADSLIKQTVVETALAMRKRRMKIDEIEAGSDEYQQYRVMEGTLLNMAMELQDKIEGND